MNTNSTNSSIDLDKHDYGDPCPEAEDGIHVPGDNGDANYDIDGYIDIDCYCELCGAHGHSAPIIDFSLMTWECEKESENKS